MGYSAAPGLASVVIRDANSGGTNVSVGIIGGVWRLFSENANNANSTVSFTNSLGKLDYFEIVDATSALKSSQVFINETNLGTENALVSTTATGSDVAVYSASGAEILRIVYKASPGTLALTFDDDGGTEINRLQGNLTGTNAHNTVKTSAQTPAAPVL